MEKSSLLKQFIRYTSLNILGMMGLSAYILADTIFIARGLGESGLAALNLAIPVYSLISALGLMTGIGGATRHTIVRVREGSRAAGQVLFRSLVLAGIMGLLLFLTGLTLSDPISRFLGATGEALEMTRTYLGILLGFAPFFLLNHTLLAYVRNDHNPTLSMAAMLAGSISNIILDWILIFPLNMGMRGAALATGISPVLSLMVLSLHFIRGHSTLSVQRTSGIGGYLSIVRLGMSTFVTELSSGVVLVVFNLVILSLAGNTGLAAYGIVANLALVVMAMFTGMAQGVQPLISNLYASGRTGDLRKILIWSLGSALTLSVAINVLTLMAAVPLVELFNRDASPVLAEYAITGLFLYFPGFLFAGVNMVGIAGLSALNRAESAFRLSLLRGLVLLIPLVILLSRLLGMTGVWLSFGVTELMTLIPLFPGIREYTGCPAGNPVCP